MASTEHRWQQPQQDVTTATAELLPLTPPQREIWLDQQLDLRQPHYNQGFCLEINGPLSSARLAMAFALLVEKHDALRLRLCRTGDAEPQQWVESQPAPPMLEDVDVSAESNPLAAADRWMRERIRQPFALFAGPLFNISLLRIAPERHTLLFCFHHLILDGWSCILLTKSLSDCYNSPRAGASAGSGVADASGAEVAHYADFAARVTPLQDSAKYARSRAFWQQQFPQMPAPLLEKKPPASSLAPPLPAGDYRVTPSWPLFEKLQASAAAIGAQPFPLLLSLIHYYLAQTRRSSEVVLGLPVLNRANARQKATVGMFAGMQAVRLQPGEASSVSALVRNTAAQLKQTYRHQQFPLSELNRLAGLRHDQRVQLFDVVVSYVHDPHALPFGDASGQILMRSSNHERLPLEIHIYVHPRYPRWNLLFIYNHTWFTRDEVARLAAGLMQLIDQACDDIHQPLHQLALQTPDDNAQIQRWNCTDQPWPAAITTLHGGFEQQVACTPDASALQYQGQSLSYATLNQRANQLARLLQSEGVQPGDRVAVLLPRGPAMVIALLASLKAGAACLPLDGNQPPERLAMMLDAGQPRLLVASECSLPAAFSQQPVLAVDDHRQRSLSAENIALQDTPPLAYVIYTSGSTGMPKGVAMPHAPLLNLLRWQSEPERRALKTLQFAAPGFDVAFQEIFSTLCRGGTLVPIAEEQRYDFSALWQLIVRQGIERLYLPWIALQHLAETLAREAEPSLPTALRQVITAGEQLRITPQIRQLFSQLPQCRLHNHYGPTETHVSVAATLEADPQRWPLLPAIGRPVANGRVYILDAQRRPLPVGAVGEIYIAGAPVADGYLGRPDLTAARFSDDPWQVGARMYQTGDLGRWCPDGSLACLGRADDQVKIRGYRVEPGEIEARLSECPGVSEAAIEVVTTESAEKRLVAYYSGQQQAASTLRQQLAQRVPDYMLPSAWIWLAALPVTANGKRDRRALPAPVWDEVTAQGAAPQGATEQALAAIWQSLLAVDRVGREDNFFEKGGHSLLAMALTREIKARFAVEMTIADLFEAATIARQAAHIALPIARKASPLARLLPVKTSDRPLPLLFCVHPASGLSWSFAGLSRGLAAHYQIYGVQSSGLDGQSPLAGSLQAMAADYIRTMKAQQPHGPWHLIGWSMGGLVAFEIACQLQAAGEQVAFLGLMDSFVLQSELRDAAPFDDLQYALAHLLSTAGCPVDHAREMPLSVEEVCQRISQQSPLFAGLTQADILAIIAVRRNNLSLFSGYRPGARFNGRLDHFTATRYASPREQRQAGRNGSQPQTHWQPWVSGPVHSWPLACTHDQMGEAAGMAAIAEIIAARRRDESDD